MTEHKPDETHVGEIVFTDHEMLIDGHRIGYLAVGSDLDVIQTGAEYKVSLTLHAFNVRFDTEVEEVKHFTPRAPLCVTPEQTAANAHAPAE